jgi:DDE superfamily endonuclease
MLRNLQEREEAMPDLMVPPTFVVLLTAFADCFTAPSYENFCWVLAGWIHCLGRRTITAVALASGAVGSRHISVFHRFFARAQWTLDALGRVLLDLALAWVPADQPLLLLVDDTLARKHGKCVALASMHHDPLLSTARKPFFSFGHVWVVLAVWVPLPMGKGRGFALPLLFRLYLGKQRGGQAEAPARRGKPMSKRRQTALLAAERERPSKLELARELIGLAANWAGERTVYVAADSLYAGRPLLEARPANVHVISRLRPNAALWTLPPPRQPGQRGRPRRRGERLPTPAVMAAARKHWHRLPVSIYGRSVETSVFRCTALWYTALREHPVRIVVVRDPAGKRKDDIFFCTDLTATARFILESYAKRWSLEVAFHDSKQYLGLEDSPAQATPAVERTAPMAALVYALILLWYAGRQQDHHVTPWLARPWYRHKTNPSFADMLTALRQESWRLFLAAPPSSARRLNNSPLPWPDAVLATA